MLPIGMVLTFTGYGIGSWGWILTKGYNIPLRSWFSPLNPYKWPAQGATIPTVPQGRLFPGPPPSASGTGSSPAPPPNSIYNVPGIGPLLHWFTSALG